MSDAQQPVGLGAEAKSYVPVSATAVTSILVSELAPKADISAADLASPTVTVLLLTPTAAAASAATTTPAAAAATKAAYTKAAAGISPSGAQAAHLVGVRLLQAVHRARYPAPCVVHVGPHLGALQTARVVRAASRTAAEGAAVRVDMRLRARGAAAELVGVATARKEVPGVVLDELVAAEGDGAVNKEEGDGELGDRVGRFVDVCLRRAAMFKTGLVVADEDVLLALLKTVAREDEGATLGRPFARGELRVCVVRRKE